MSALGHKRTSTRLVGMSALPPKADIRERDRYVRFVPQADILAPSFKRPRCHANRLIFETIHVAL
jgi:hypothetical protein